MWEKGSKITTKIQSLAYQGHGIAKPEGWTLFVPRTAPGDEVEVRLDRVKKSHGFGAVTKLITPSPVRIEAPCTYFETCGGCHYQHIEPTRVHKEKQQQIQDAWTRLGPGSTQISPMVFTDQAFGYRNRITFTRSKNSTQGFVSWKHTNIVDIQECIIAEPILMEAWEKIKPVIKPISASVMPYITLRSIADEVLVVFAVTPDFALTELTKRFEHAPWKMYATVTSKKKPQAIGKDLTPLFHEPIFLEQRIGNTTYVVRPDVFFQTNFDMTEQLVSFVMDQIPEKTEKLLDLYCGVGLFTLSAAQKGIACKGIEFQKQAIHCATQSAMLNGLESKTEFVTAKAQEVIGDIDEDFDCIVVDPPRNGMDETMTRQLCELGARTIIYVSCNPTTLARDAKTMVELGYQAQSVTPFEMFPQTYHVETVAVFFKEI